MIKPISGPSVVSLLVWSGLLAFGQVGCSSAPDAGSEPSATLSNVGATGSSLTVEEGDEAVRAACRGPHENHGQCVSCVAHVHTSLTSDFAQGECHDGCIKTSCSLEGKTCGTVSDGCGGELVCGPPCGPTFEVTCTQRIFGCTSPVGDVVTTTTQDVVIKLYPTIVPAFPVPTGTVILSPSYRFIFGDPPGGGGNVTSGLVGSLEGITYKPFGAAGYLEYASYSVNRSTMTFSSVSHRQSHGTCGGSAYVGGHKVCTGFLKTP